MENTTPQSCPYTVTVRRNPPRRARATPQSLNIAPFPNEEISSLQTSQTPSTSDNENLKVFLRIRPFQPLNQALRVRDKAAWPKNLTKKISVTNNPKKKSSSCISINDSQSVTLLVPSELQESKRVKSETYGGFTHVFPSDSSQVEVYERMVKPMVDEFLKGRSGMLAALGPSGSGKTHTVFGSTRNPGMVPLVLHHIFKETESDGKQASRSFYIAIFEIYTERGKTEKLLDLLPDGGELSMQQSTVKGQREVLIYNAEQAESLIAQAVIKRATAMTNTNSQSSRSQCIINIRDVPKKFKEVVNSKSNDAVLTIIDLAGAEREKRTGNQGTRLVESNFINNTLMVFGLCLRSLLEHQKNPKKQLQKHFQNSMLTRYLRDYLEGKKRMTLLLTAKSGDDDYLDTSHLLRQASPYMQIKYNEVEQSNIVPTKRHLQASSIIDNGKQAHLKRMRIVNEHNVQNDEKGVKECNTSKKDVSTLCKVDSHAGGDRNHIIMRNFARVIWNELKQYNSKLTVAEKEILNLKESIEYEKKRNIELEAQLNGLRAACTCGKEENAKTDAKDCSSVDLDPPHNLDQEETFHAESSSEPRPDQSDAEHMLCTTCSELDSEKPDRELSVSSSKSRHHDALEVDVADKIPSETFHSETSFQPTLDQSDEEQMLGSTCTVLDSEDSDREVSVSLSKPGLHQAFEVVAAMKEPSESFNAESLSKHCLDQLDEEYKLGATCTELESEISDREVSVSSSKPGHDNSLEVLEVDVVSKIPSETLHAQSSSEPMLGPCTPLDSEKSDELVLGVLASSKPGDHEYLEVDAKNKMSSGLLDSSFSAKNEILESSSPKVASSIKTRSDIGVNNSCKPARPKRTLMPSSSLLSRDLSTFDLEDESEKLKGNRNTRKVGARDDPRRTNGSISLLNLLQRRKENIRH